MDLGRGQVANPTITGAPNGHNCLFSVKSYGSRSVMVTDIQYVVQINSTESNAAHSHTFYPLNTYVSTFDISLVFKTYAERESLNKWLRTYMERVSSNQSIGGYVYVYCPIRKFTRDGVLQGNLTYGDSSPNDMAYPCTLRFTGTRDPISIKGGNLAKFGQISQFIEAKNDKADAPFFYPAGTQKAGKESLAGTLYDNPVNTPKIPAPPKPPKPPSRKKQTPVKTKGGGKVPV